MLYATSINIVFHLVLAFIREVPASSDSGKKLVVKLLKIPDILFIAITSQIIAISLYRLFISPVGIEGSKFLNTLKINHFHDLKITLVQISVVILVVLLLE